MKLEKLGPGSILGHFQIVDTLGSGGMGIVFRAHDLRLERQVALKVLSPELFRDDAARARFIREAQLAASVTHPNVAVIHEVHVERETPFIAMELVPGRNVKDLLDGGPMAVLDVLSLGRQICGALDAAHRLGIVHRDIKSSNIVVTPEGQGKVLDFGLAKALWELAEAEREGGRTPPRPRDASPERRSPASSVGGPRTGTGKVVGTPSYMSPEQTTGGATDERSDIFSLGVVLYECLTGRLPFRGATEDEVLDAIRGEDPPPIDHSRHVVPRELRSAIERCLAKRPGDRYASARELGEELGRIERRISTRRSLAPRSLARRGVESWSRLGVFPRERLRTFSRWSSIGRRRSSSWDGSVWPHSWKGWASTLRRRTTWSW